MYKHTHAGFLGAGFSAAVDAGGRRGSTGEREKRWRGWERNGEEVR